MQKPYLARIKIAFFISKFSVLAVLLKMIVCWWCEHLALILPPSSLPPYCSRITFQSRFFNNGYGGCCIIFGNKRVNINNFGLDSRYTRPEPASRPVTRLLMRYCPRRSSLSLNFEYIITTGRWKSPPLLTGWQIEQAIFHLSPLVSLLRWGEGSVEFVGAEGKQMGVIRCRSVGVTDSQLNSI